MAEGEETETSYFKGLVSEKKIYNVQIFGAGLDPLGVAKDAISRKVNAEKRARLESDNSLLFDFVFAVFDRDDHDPKRIDLAKNMCLKNGVVAIFSNPSFEYWLLLHFEFTTSLMSQNDALNRLKSHIPFFEKSCEISHFLSLTSDACRNAIKGEKSLRFSGQLNENPYTNCYRILERLHIFSS